MAFVSRSPWKSVRPRDLVVACSDGRLQSNVDEFLSQSLAIRDYDRLYLPGGPGALATSGVEYVRADAHRRELAFLLIAHQIERMVLVFHGPAPDGPVEAMCADYARLMGGASTAEVSAQQQKDFKEVVEFVRERKPGTLVEGYRCEVQSDRTIQFVDVR